VTSRTKNYFLTTLYINAKGSHQGGIMKLIGKKALITGGNSGIGLATARLFVAEGAEVVGPNARGYRAEVTVADDRKRLFADLAKDFGKLDIVIVNAGISGRTPTGSTDEAIFENVIRTNLKAAFFR
jgi:NAD(P)-dependent dehydrogenase (short-subunit alcohol dehydrogenase family)